MSKRAAKALRIKRNSTPFRDSVDKRVDIDTAAEHLHDPVAVGDTVVCRHGSGTLTECDDGPEGPCCVDIKIGGAVHTSKFKRMDNGTGGGRVRREPTSFAHDSRAARKDQTQDHVMDKVLHSRLISVCALLWLDKVLHSRLISESLLINLHTH